MKFSFVGLLFILICSFSTFSSPGQEPQTIRIRKESNLVKAVFDGTESRLFVVDRFGNPRENKILSYKLYVKAKRETKEFTGYSNKLSGEMISYLNKQTSATKFFLQKYRRRKTMDI